MPINKDRRVDVAMSEETLARAEEMCSGLSLSVTIEKRGQSLVVPAMLDDLQSMDQQAESVEVVLTPDHPWPTVLTRHPLPDRAQVLLVYRRPDGGTHKVLGRLEASRPGLRDEDPADLFVTTLNVEREIDD
ncbi:hypothetical protein [Wenzhouxiangella limi]|uniref:Uncharacterized protein n=1 Tax=Wenzhouxiangella limi TaxID=2707351 RepID=A0A845V1W1_9GAMM|nr:hypothetical protein [Wenzhouxiangella limi]NDY96704.1 hypothetical protein [Wenzhouxiangella limi]